MNDWELYDELVARNPTSLTPRQHDLVAFGALRTEVNNGGFDSLADLIARAMAAFRDYPTDRVARQERLEQMTAEGRTFQSQDEEYYALELAMDSIRR